MDTDPVFPTPRGLYDFERESTDGADRLDEHQPPNSQGSHAAESNQQLRTPSASGDPAPPLTSGVPTQVSSNAPDSDGSWRIAPGPQEPQLSSGSGIPAQSPLAATAGSMTAADDSSPQLPEPLRSDNGPIIIGEASSLNKKAWHESNWYKLPPDGAPRDVDVAHGLVGDVPVMGISLRGTKNQYRGSSNEDAFFVAHNDNWIVAVVADGVSNAEHSAYGARFFAEFVARSMTRTLLSADQSGEPVDKAVVRAIKKASADAGKWGELTIGSPSVPRVWPDEIASLLATTISVMVVSRHVATDGRRRVEYAAIGDSPAYVLSEGTWSLVTRPTKEGDIVSLATASVPLSSTSPLALETATRWANPGDALMLMTDGISTSLGRGSTDVGRWLGQHFSSPCLLSDGIEAVRFDRRGEDDDRTLVVVWVPMPQVDSQDAG